MVLLPNNYNATKICLDGKELTEIPKEVFLYKNLRKLSLRNNRIKKIPKEIRNLKLLVNLNLSNNELTSLYANLFELEKLEVLILNNNRIKSVPERINKLQRLRKLGLANNKIADFNEITLPNLVELNLSGNLLRRIPFSIRYMNKLKKLWLTNNDIKRREVTFIKRKLPYLNNVYYQVKEEPIKNIMSTSEVNKDVANHVADKGNKRHKIFISYSHYDDNWRERVEENIKVLSNYSALDIETWSDKKIQSGKEWKKEIERALNESIAAVLLISTKFLASDFIRENELPPLLSNAEKKGTLILPLIISPCRFTKIESISRFQAVNNPTTEILTKLSEPEQDEVLVKLTDDIEKHLNSQLM